MNRQIEELESLKASLHQCYLSIFNNRHFNAWKKVGYASNVVITLLTRLVPLYNMHEPVRKALNIPIENEQDNDDYHELLDQLAIYKMILKAINKLEKEEQNGN